MPLEPAPHRWRLARLGRDDQRRLAARRRHQLRVEQIGPRSRRQAARRRRGTSTYSKPGTSCSQRSTQRALVGERLLVREQHALVGDGDHIIVECAGGDRIFRLLGENGALGIEPVQPRNRFRRLDMLPRRKGAAGHAVDEDLDARLAMRWGQPHVIGRALVAECRRDRRDEPRRAAGSANAICSCASVPGHSWLRCGMVRRLATVRWHRPSAVSGAGETVAALAAHIARCRHRIGGKRRLGLLDRRPERGRASRGAGAGAAGRCPGASPSARFARILSSPERRRRGCDTCAGVARRGDVAEAQPRIIVARADDPVEVDLAQRHLSASTRATSSSPTFDVEQLGRFLVDADRPCAAAASTDA